MHALRGKDACITKEESLKINNLSKHYTKLEYEEKNKLKRKEIAKIWAEIGKIKTKNKIVHLKFHHLH